MERGKCVMEKLNKNFLDSIDGKNLNFLIGAGASSSSLKTIAHNDKKEKGKETVPSIEDLFNKYENDRIAAALLKFIFFSMSVKNGLITAHSKRDKGVKENLKNYKIFIKNVITLLNSTGFERPKRANIFTTNYDTFFELAFDQIAHMHPLAYFNDGSRGFFTREVSYENYFFNISHSGSMDTYRREIPSINLYKMHGSLSWNKKTIDKDDIIISSNTNPVLDSLTKAKDNESFYEKVYKEINIFYINLKNPGSSNESEEAIKKVTEEELLINFERLLNNLKKTEIKSATDSNTSLKKKVREDLRKFKEIYDALLVVNPTKTKFKETVFEEQYYQLFRAFEEELQKPNSVLIVFGFSFKDKHINDILKRCLTNPTLQVFVVPYSQKDELNVKEIFTGYGNVSFLKEESESKDKDLANENIEYKNGDFDVLNDFLSGKNDINEHN